MDNGSWTMTCGQCGEKSDPSPDWHHCPYCGTRINPMSGTVVHVHTFDYTMDHTYQCKCGYIRGKLAKD